LHHPYSSTSSTSYGVFHLLTKNIHKSKIRDIQNDIVVLDSAIQFNSSYALVVSGIYFAGVCVIGLYLFVVVDDSYPIINYILYTLVCISISHVAISLYFNHIINARYRHLQEFVSRILDKELER
jgi:hypothetical protein